jgi:hypothetical protein
MINSERNLTLMPRAVAAPGESLEDWRIIARIACAMGYAEAFDYPDAEAVYEEIRRFWNPATGYDLRGIGYAELRERRASGLRPGQSTTAARCATATTASASTCCAMPGPAPALAFPRQRQGAFLRPALVAGGRAAGRRLPHGAQHRPRAAPVAHPDQDRQGAGLNKLEPGPFVEIHPDDAGAWASPTRTRWRSARAVARRCCRRAQ